MQIQIFEISHESRQTVNLPQKKMAKRKSELCIQLSLKWDYSCSRVTIMWDFPLGIHLKKYASLRAISLRGEGSWKYGFDISHSKLISTEEQTLRLIE